MHLELECTSSSGIRSWLMFVMCAAKMAEQPQAPQPQAPQPQASQQLPVVDERPPGSAALDAVQQLLGSNLVPSNTTTALLMAFLVFSVIGSYRRVESYSLRDGALLAIPTYRT